KAWVGYHGDSERLVLQQDPDGTHWVDRVSGTLDGSWTAFTFRNNATGAYLTQVRANQAGATLRAFTGLQVSSGTPGRGALVVRSSVGNAEAVLDLATGGLRMVVEGPVDNHSIGFAFFGQPYMTGTAYVDSAYNVRAPILMPY